MLGFDILDNGWDDMIGSCDPNGCYFNLYYDFCLYVKTDDLQDGRLRAKDSFLVPPCG